MLFHKDLVEHAPRRSEFAFREDRMFLLEVALLKPRFVVVEGCGGYWVKHQQQMQSNYAGYQSTVVNLQHLQIYKRILSTLEAEGKLAVRYKKAACTLLWTLAHWIAKDNLLAGVSVYNWILELDPEFKIPTVGFINTLYRRLGFTTTEKILKIRRFLLHGWY